MSMMFVEKKRAALLCMPIGAALPIYCLEKLGRAVAASWDAGEETKPPVRSEEAAHGNKLGVSADTNIDNTK